MTGSTHQSNSTSEDQVQEALDRLLTIDPFLKPYQRTIQRRLLKINQTEARLTGGITTLADFAQGHEFFGLHFQNNQWVFREWAPNADKIFLTGDMTGWRENEAYSLKRLSEGIWEIRLPPNTFKHEDLYRLRIHWPKGKGDRIPAYARRVVQDPETFIFNAQVWRPAAAYQWKCQKFQRPSEAPYIYEAHIGMAQQEEKIGSFREFSSNIIPRIVDGGYNTIQLMAIQEHPYYGSFGYQVSNFFAVSSRFGSPDDLKALIDEAHCAGLAVLMDIIHSHAVTNETEGLSRFDGTLYQYFHDGQRGRHDLWDSRCFDYGKHQVLHFLLSNCRFWLEEFHFDGFRFDGITSMLYLHHGLSKAFTTYDDYFSDSVDEDALTYLALANRLIHTLKPHAITIAEDVSGMPGLAALPENGGFGFDYRFAMGVPDNWIKLIKEVSDENWSMGHLWFELTNRRDDEKTISYAESHDQALVGDKSIIFRLIAEDMYDHMRVGDENVRVDRGIALHKMIRLITLATAGAGYLNFMGNEFGHPEWIDFPREGNNWSCKYARRQWHLMDDPNLKYQYLLKFDRDMIALAKKYRLLDTSGPNLVYEHSDNKITIFERSGLLFAFNFHPQHSYMDYRIETEPGRFKMLMDSDAMQYGGHGRLVTNQVHATELDASRRIHLLSLYLPTRTAIILQLIKD
ncbi:MAG: alpha amylase C-terminal domain-containing protein [Desulfobacterales bacterium]|jgi:1,4-alpha-glucan branching enzyme